MDRLKKSKKEMSFLFIDQPSSGKGLNFNLALLSTMLLEKGCRVEVLDLNNSNLPYPLGTYGILTKAVVYKLDYDYLQFEIDKFKPDAVVINVVTPRCILMVDQAKRLIAFLKKNYPSLPIIIEGLILALDSQKTMEVTQADIGIVGEGDYTIQELYDYFCGKRDLDSIQGIAFRKDNKILETPPRPFITNLDELPFPNYGIFSTVIANNNIICNYPIYSSRGCPYSCIFCFSPVVEGKKWRSRSAENVLQEIRDAKKKHKIQSIIFADTNFFFDVDRAKRILKSIIDEKLVSQISTVSGTRADCLDRELLLLLKKSGAKCVYIGIESTHPEVFRMVLKGETFEEIEETIRNAKETGLNRDGTFIVGLPNSTYKKDLYSIEYAKKLGLNHTWFGLAVAFPKTEMWQWVKNHGRFLRDFTEAETSHLEKGLVHFETSDYPAEKRLEVLHRALVATRDFPRLGYQLKGIKKYMQICFMCFKYEKKALFIYHYFLFQEILYSIPEKSYLYYILKKIKNLFVKSPKNGS